MDDHCRWWVKGSPTEMKWERGILDLDVFRDDIVIVKGDDLNEMDGDGNGNRIGRDVVMGMGMEWNGVGTGMRVDGK
jgi:hypothetical protein